LTQTGFIRKNDLIISCAFDKQVKVDVKMMKVFSFSSHENFIISLLPLKAAANSTYRVIPLL
jgi:hypothetical protein